MNEELNKKIAEWVGFIEIKQPSGWVEGIWKHPFDGTGDGVVDKSYDFLPDFTTSLDACFKYIVPNRISEVTFMYASNCASCDIEDLEANFFEGHVNTDSIEEAWQKSALALCLAVEKLIDA